MESCDSVISIADKEKNLDEPSKSESQDLKPYSQKECDSVNLGESSESEGQDLQPHSSQKECDPSNLSESSKSTSQDLQPPSQKECDPVNLCESSKSTSQNLQPSSQKECDPDNLSESSKSTIQDLHPPSQKECDPVNPSESSKSTSQDLQPRSPQKECDLIIQETESSQNDDHFNKSMSEILLTKIKVEPIDDYEVGDSNDTFIHGASTPLDVDIKPILHRSRKRKRSKGRLSGKRHSSNSHSSDVSVVDRKLFPSRPGIVFQVGARLKAKDSQNWYDAKITEIDEELSEIKVHFDRWNSRYDQWIKMDSKNLKALSPERLQKTNSSRRYKIGDEVLARWKDRQMYPAKVIKVLDNISYMVKFYDGFVNKMQSINMELLPEKFTGKLIVASTSTQPSAGISETSSNIRDMLKINPPQVQTPIDLEPQKVATKVAAKEFIIEEDHNHFKCQVTECEKSFRKEKLLESHMKHYHNMLYDPSANIRSLRSSEHLKSPLADKSCRDLEMDSSVAISPKPILETRETAPKDSAKVLKSASTPVPTSKADFVSEVEPASVCEPTCKTTQTLKTTAASKVLSTPKPMPEKPISKPCRAHAINKKKTLPLPQRSSSRRISLPAKFASDEICLLQPIGRSAGGEKVHDKEKEETISKSQKAKERTQTLKDVTEEEEKDVQLISVKVEPLSPTSCNSLSPRKETNRKSLEPIRKMVMDESLDPSRIEQIVTLKSNTQKDRTPSPSKARTSIPSPQPINPRITDKEPLVEHKIKPKLKKSEIRISRQGHYKGRRKDALKKTTHFQMKAISETYHKNLSISEVSDVEGKSPMQVQNETPQDIAIKTSEGDSVSLASQASDISTKSPSVPNDQLVTNPLVNHVATEVPSTFDANFPNAATSDMVSKSSSDNDSVIAGSKLDSQDPILKVAQLQVNMSIDSIREKELEGTKPRKMDLTIIPITPRHVMCTRRKEAILEKEKASQAVGGHVMCTRKKSVKLAAVEEQFRQKMSSPTKSESPVPTSKPNKRRKFPLSPRERLNTSKLDSHLGNEINNSEVNGKGPSTSFIKQMKVEQPPTEMADVGTSGIPIEATNVKPVADEVVHCICDSIEEEGLMMQCEICLTWQHGFCFNIELEKDVPEKYICYACLDPKGLRESFRYKHDQDWFKNGKLPSFPFCQRSASSVNPISIAETHSYMARALNLKKVLQGVSYKLNIVSAESHPDLYLFQKSSNEESTDEAEPEDKEPDIHEANAMDSDMATLSSADKDFALDNTKLTSPNLVTFDHSYYSPQADILDLDAMPLIIEDDMKSDVENNHNSHSVDIDGSQEVNFNVAENSCPVETDSILNNQLCKIPVESSVGLPAEIVPSIENLDQRLSDASEICKAHLALKTDIPSISIKNGNFGVNIADIDSGSLLSPTENKQAALLTVENVENNTNSSNVHMVEIEGNSSNIQNVEMDETSSNIQNSGVEENSLNIQNNEVEENLANIQNAEVEGSLSNISSTLNSKREISDSSISLFSKINGPTLPLVNQIDEASGSEKADNETSKTLKDKPACFENFDAGSSSNNEGKPSAFFFNGFSSENELPSPPFNIFNDFNVSSKCKRNLMDNIKLTLTESAVELDKLEEFIEAMEADEEEFRKTGHQNGDAMSNYKILKRLIRDLETSQRVARFHES